MATEHCSVLVCLVLMKNVLELLCFSHTQLLLKNPNLYTLLVIILIINSKHSCIAKSQVKMLVIISPANS